MAYTGSLKVARDEAKNLANRRYHGVSFEEAMGLFTSGTRSTRPDGPAIALLRIAARHPRIIREDVEAAA